jgi:uncharacterized protein (DUF1778 family)
MDAKKQNRTSCIIMRVTEEEKAIIEKKADERGLSLSGYVRMMVLGVKK